jgi:hypothetical protein
MSGAKAEKVDNGAADTSALDPNVRVLLDHIAAELAEEYIRLMEAAAAAHADSLEGDQR